MIHFRRVVGDSMKPTLRNGQTVIISETRDFKPGDVVVAFVGDREVIKRIDKMSDGKVFLLGDNPNHSTDSRKRGWLQDRHITGKVLWPRIHKKLK